MKFCLGMVVVFLVLIIAPSALGCESCIQAGTADPVGIVKNYKRCYTQDSGNWTWCYGECVGGTGTGCPVPGSNTGPRGNLQQPTLRTSVPATETGNCDVDLAGRCTARPIQVDSFLR
jgi:hypothetical protein